MKMWRWSNATTSLIWSDSNMPLPKTSPDMSPMPATVNGVVCVLCPNALKCRLTDSHAPRAVMPIFLWS